jgi:hypothetical protein
MFDFPVAPPILVKDTPRPRKLTTLAEARAYVDDALHARRLSLLRELKDKLDGAGREDDAVEAIGALREWLALEGLIAEEPAGFVRRE